MKLVTAQEVLTRMNLAGLANDKSAVAVESCIEGGAVQLSSFIRSDLAFHTRGDYFTLEERHIDRNSYTVKLRLSQRFVSDKTPVVVKQKSSLSSALYDTPANMDTVPETQYIVDKSRGFITLFSPISLGYNVIYTEYQAGFKDYDTKAPAALKEAAIAFAIAVNYQQTVTVGKKETRNNASTLFVTAQNTASGLIIPNGEGVSPSMTQVIK